MPLPLEPHLLFIKLETNTYLIANITWLNNSLKEMFFILRITPCTILQLSGVNNIPKSFMKAVSLVEISLEKVLSHLTGAITG